MVVPFNCVAVLFLKLLQSDFFVLENDMFAKNFATTQPKMLRAQATRLFQSTQKFNFHRSISSASHMIEQVLQIVQKETFAKSNNSNAALVQQFTQDMTNFYSSLQRIENVQQREQALLSKVEFIVQQMKSNALSMEQVQQVFRHLLVQLADVQQQSPDDNLRAMIRKNREEQKRKNSDDTWKTKVYSKDTLQRVLQAKGLVADHKGRFPNLRGNAEFDDKTGKEKVIKN